MCLSVLKFASFASPPFTAVNTNLLSPSAHLLPLSLRWWFSTVDVCWRSTTLSSVPTSWHCTRRVTSLPGQVETHLQYRNSLTIYKCFVPMATIGYTPTFLLPVIPSALFCTANSGTGTWNEAIYNQLLMHQNSEFAVYAGSIIILFNAHCRPLQMASVWLALTG